MHDFNIFLGESGRVVLKKLISNYLINWDKKALIECTRLIYIDQSDADRRRILPENFENRYLDYNKNNNNDFENSSQTNKDNDPYYKGKLIDQRLLTYILEPESFSAGVGKNWPTAKRMAEDAWNCFSKRCEEEIIFSDHIHLCHSGGGGTGCGASPVFSKKIKQLQINSNHKRAITASVFLPDSSYMEPERAVPNTCSTIGNHSTSCDGIFLYDVSKKVNLDSLSKDVKETRAHWPDKFDAINYAATEVQLMLTSFNNRICTNADIDFEGSDLITLCHDFESISNCALICPCVSEYDTKLLKENNLKGLVKDLLTNNAMVDYCQDHFIEKIVLFIRLPVNLNHDLTQEAQFNQIQGWKEEIIPSADVADIFFSTSKRPFGKIKMIALLINPVLPRLYEMQNQCLERIVNWANSLMCDNEEPVQRIINDLLSYLDEKFKDWQNPLGKNLEYQKIINKLGNKRIEISEQKTKTTTPNKASQIIREFEQYTNAYKLYCNLLINMPAGKQSTQP
jgi:hypothetical protein